MNTYFKAQVLDRLRALRRASPSPPTCSSSGAQRLLTPWTRIRAASGDKGTGAGGADGSGGPGGATEGSGGSGGPAGIPAPAKVEAD
ncbi:hypothetical protein SCYAM73S_03770 [Streptomyces cyaneofuscatus]